MRSLLKPFIAFAAVGLLASVVVHISALLRIPNPFGQYAWALHAGIFVVWLPAVLVMNKTMANFSFKQKDIWKVALAGCPAWMKSMVFGFFIYAGINFAIFVMRTMGQDPKHMDLSIEFQGFSGHWMAFYSAALGVLYSATQHVESKCANGHTASPAAKFCEQCGSPVITTSNEAS